MGKRKVRWADIKWYGTVSLPAIAGASASILSRDPIFLPVGFAGGALAGATLPLDIFERKKKRNVNGKKHNS
jgi:hypothetical protein